MNRPVEDTNIVIGCDNAAVDFKTEIVACLRKRGYQVEDFGINDPGDNAPYAAIARRVAENVLATPGKRGILFCGTGIGMAIAANKIKGIRAAQVHDSFSAERAALSNDAHIITMGARVIGLELAKKLALEWLGHRFQPGGPSSAKIECIHELENIG